MYNTEEGLDWWIKTQQRSSVSIKITKPNLLMFHWLKNKKNKWVAQQKKQQELEKRDVEKGRRKKTLISFFTFSTNRKSSRFNALII